MTVIGLYADFTSQWSLNYIAVSLAMNTVDVRTNFLFMTTWLMWGKMKTAATDSTATSSSFLPSAKIREYLRRKVCFPTNNKFRLVDR